jgi:opacity protein-like surface antigen
MFIVVPTVNAGDCVKDVDFYVSAKGVSAKAELNGVNFATIPNGLVSTNDTNASETYISPGFALGIHYSKYFRTEIEYIDRGDMDYSSDGIIINDKSALIPYIGKKYKKIPGNLLNIRAGVDTKTVFLNQYIDSKTWHGLGFYGGFGVGLAMHKAETSFILDEGGILQGPFTGPIVLINEKVNNTSFAYSIGTGIYYNIKAVEGLTLDLGYRYLNLGEVDMGTLIESKDMTANEIMCCIRYQF